MKSSDTRIFLIFTLCLFLSLISQAQEGELNTAGMSKEKRNEESESFRRNFQLVQEMRGASKSHRHMIIEMSENEIAKKQLLSKDAWSKRKVSQMSRSYAAGLHQSMVGEKYIVNLAYAHDGQYPTMYGGSGTFRDNKDSAFLEKKTNEILSDFLGENYTKFNAKLLAVSKGVIIDVQIDNPEQFDYLLNDPRLLGVKHIGNPPDVGLIFIDD